MFKKEKNTQAQNNHKKDKELFIQPKLSFGKSGDKYEVEADKMADKVVNKPTESKTVQKKEGDDKVQAKSLSSEITPLVQRMEGGEEESVQQKSEEEKVQKSEEEETVQSKEEEEAIQKKEEEEAVQRKNEDEIQAKEEEEIQSKKVTNKPTKQSGNFESKLRRGNGGQQLDQKIKGEMESGFGSDFSHIKIHNDTEAAKLSTNINAQAFTHGNDIYFNKGKYNPNSKEGKILLAHELTHTIQQKGAKEKKIQRKPDSRVPSNEKKDKNTLDKYKTAFPYFYKYMNDHFGDYLTGSDKIKKAMLKNTVGALTPEKIKEITRFGDGNGPNIELVNFTNPDQNGLYNYQANTISLSGKLIEKYEEIMADPNATIEKKKAISISLNQVLINEFTHYGDALDSIDAIKNNKGEVINNPSKEGSEGNFTSDYDEGNEAVAEIFEFYGTSLTDGLQNYAAHKKGIYLDPNTLKEIKKNPALLDESLIPPIPKTK